MAEKAARPVLKWAGGKTQLLKQFDQYFPPELNAGKITRYIEPFFGGGSVFFHIKKNYLISSAFLSDINERLIILYTIIRDRPKELLRELYPLSQRYTSSECETFFYARRDEYNSILRKVKRTPQDRLREAALTIFLNRTCYNGLFRVNSSGEFNAPHGDNDHPKIVDEERILLASNALKTAHLSCHSFESALVKTLRHDRRASSTFVYFDPPYRPLTKTSHFTTYSGPKFDDAQQIRLAKAFRDLDNAGAKVMLSNSDPKNHNPADDFFDKLYAGFNLNRIPARRSINSKGDKRGVISELVITNY